MNNTYYYNYGYNYGETNTYTTSNSNYISVINGNQRVYVDKDGNVINWFTDWKLKLPFSIRKFEI